MSFFSDLLDDFQLGWSYFSDVIDPATPFRTSQKYGRDIAYAGMGLPPSAPVPDFLETPRPSPIRPIDRYRPDGTFRPQAPQRHPIARERGPKVLQASSPQQAALLEILTALQA